MAATIPYGNGNSTRYRHSKDDGSSSDAKWGPRGASSTLSFILSPLFHAFYIDGYSHSTRTRNAPPPASTPCCLLRPPPPFRLVPSIFTALHVCTHHGAFSPQPLSLNPNRPPSTPTVTALQPLVPVLKPPPPQLPLQPPTARFDRPPPTSMA
jgi:hypothetical protein